MDTKGKRGLVEEPCMQENSRSDGQCLEMGFSKSTNVGFYIKIQDRIHETQENRPQQEL